MPDKPRFVRELARVCAPGGRVILVTWCHRDLDLARGEKRLRRHEASRRRRRRTPRPTLARPLARRRRTPRGGGESWRGAPPRARSFGGSRGAGAGALLRRRDRHRRRRVRENESDWYSRGPIRSSVPIPHSCPFSLAPGPLPQRWLLGTINACYYLPRWCSVADYTRLFEVRNGVRHIRD
jgi:hypothetical protein